MKTSRLLTLVATLLALTVFQGMALADYAFDLDSPPADVDGVVGELVQFHNTLSNTGSSNDTYHISIVKSAPEDWTATMCEGTTCYPPFITEIDVELSAGNNTNLDIDLTPLSVGTGSVTVTVASTANPALTTSRTFTVHGYLNLDFDFHAPDVAAVDAVGVLHAFHTTLTNNSDADDIYTISMVKNAPESWTTSMCEGSTCYPPFILEIDVNVAAGDQVNIDIDVTPGALGEGSAQITVASQNTPAQTETKTFTVITPGLDVLLVAGDNGMGNDSWYHDAIIADGKTIATWKRQEMGILSNEEISEFSNVVWESGTLSGGLDLADMASLAYLVQHGGNLLLSGQNLAYSYCDPASADYSASTKSWFNSILKTDYAENEGPGDFAAGFENDMVTGDLFFNLYGGNGAGNNTTMDALTALSDGIATIEYGSGNTGAVRASYGSGKTFFCGFAFEGIDTTENRNAFMHQALAWFAGNITAVDGVVAPLMASVPYASPNPFNPQTIIRFEVGGSSSVPAEVIIYNLRGQAVRSLFQGSVSPGPQNMVWNGRSNDGRTLATGVYMAQVRLGEESRIVKMTLVK